MGKFRISPVTRKRWLLFRNNRRAWGSLVALAVLYIISLGAGLICNDVPLYLRFDGRSYFPALRHTSQEMLFGNGVAARPDYGRLRDHPVFRGRRGNFMVFAPVPHGPHQVADPAALEPYRRATLRIEPAVARGRLNLTRDGRVQRAVGCAPFFGGAEPPDGTPLAGFWRTTPDFEDALAERFANRPAPALTVTLDAAPTEATAPTASTAATAATVDTAAAGDGHSSDDDEDEDEGEDDEAAARLEVSLVAYAPREVAPASVRLALGAPGAPGSMPFEIRLDRRRDGSLEVRDHRAWERIPASGRDGLLQWAGTASTSATGRAGITIPWRGTGTAAATFRLDPVSWPHRPVPGHWMGIDAAGRDVLARVLYGTRTALSFGLLLVVWAALLGLVIGAVQGYFGGMVDLATQRFIEIWSALPFLYVMILLGAVLGRSFGLLLLCYGLFNWIGISYYMRAEFLRLRQRAFVEAAHCQGLGAGRIIWRHILPNALTPLITLLPFSLVGAIGSITALDFLGFGLPPLTPSWGELLQQAQQNRSAWWLILYPSLYLFTVMLLTVFIGEGLRDAFDPKPSTRYR